MAGNEVVNKQTGEIEDVASGNAYGDTIQAFPGAVTPQAKANQFNALNSANSLTEYKGETLTIVGFVSMPGTRTVRDPITGIDTNQTVPTDDTVFLDDKGNGWFTQSHGIAKSVRNLIAAYGEPANWPDGKLKVQIVETKTGRGKMKLLKVVC